MLADEATRAGEGTLTVSVNPGSMGAQEARQVAAVRLPMVSVEAGRIGLGAGGGVVGGRQLVDQLLPVL
jgi:hypothetical protein